MKIISSTSTLSDFHSTLASLSGSSNFPEIRFDLEAELRTVAGQVEDEAKRAPKAIFSPLQFEALLVDIGRLLDRCLLLRREAEDAYALAVQQLFDHLLFSEQVDALRRIELDEGLVPSTTEDLKGHVRARDKFDLAGGGEPLSGGFKEIAEGRAQQAQRLLDWYSERETLVNKKWSVIQNHRTALNVLQTAPGGSMNAAYRYKRACDHLLEEFHIAYLKAIYAADGLVLVQGLRSLSLRLTRVPLEGSILDEFVSWARKSITLLEREQHYDQRHEVILSACSLNGFNKQPNDGFTRADFANAMSSDGLVKIHFEGLLSSGECQTRYLLRCRSVGLSFSHGYGPDGTPGGGSAADRANRAGNMPWHRATAFVYPPATKYHREGEDREIDIPCPPLLISTIGESHPHNPVKMVSTGPLYNVDPVGDWYIKVNMSVWWPEHSESNTARTRQQLIDIKLHLDLVTSPGRSRFTSDPRRAPEYKW